MRIWWTLCGHAVMSIMECVNLRCRLRSNVCWHVRCFVKMLARRSYGQVRKVKLASVSICLLHPFISSHESSCHTALPWSPMTVFNILRSSSHFSTSRHSALHVPRGQIQGCLEICSDLGRHPTRASKNDRVTLPAHGYGGGCENMLDFSENL